MNIKSAVLVTLLALALFLALGAAAKTGTGQDTAPKAAAGNQKAHNDAMRFEGEKRFHANCGRCHVAPPKFPPRMMATIVRHMRVRATITEKDMRLILRYMTQ